MGATMPMFDPENLLRQAGEWRKEAAKPSAAGWRDLYLTVAQEYEHQAARVTAEKQSQGAPTQAGSSSVPA